MSVQKLQSALIPEFPTKNLNYWDISGGVCLALHFKYQHDCDSVNGC